MQKKTAVFSTLWQVILTKTVFIGQSSLPVVTYNIMMLYHESRLTGTVHGNYDIFSDI
ncbi:hypothetical protein PEC301296_19140 [Pectobacterium carotovorum subsp. carotovorum]|nr:hypothetical protein PEC301296_19140 [Pectobacterium carotovorum subsp. carotovorum]